MKIIRILAWSIIALSSSTYIHGIETKKETDPIASMPLGTAVWDFEFKNKYAAKVYITVENNGRKILDRTEVKTYAPLRKPQESDYGYIRTTGLDLNKPTTIIIYAHKAQQDVYATHYKTTGNGKTIYVTLEKTNMDLRPQVGKGVFTKTTQSGLPLKNNISSKDLTRFQVER